MVYSDNYQSTWAPAGYWRAPGHEEEYLSKSVFLAQANNEVNFSQARKDAFLSVDKFLFIMWDNEQTIVPKESSWWGQWDNNYNLLHRNQTRLYQEDLIGLKTLEETGRATFITIPGGHMDYTWEEVDSIVIPFLTDSGTLVIK